MPEARESTRGPRGFWSGTISFGLVSVPVSLFVATRASRVALRMVDQEGTPLRRRYFCSSDEEPLAAEDIVRGYEVEKDRYVVVEDEELDAVAPEKSQEIDLQRFVDVDDVDPVYFERAYFLAPGRGGARPYRLLARAMEESGRAGIATFVMRGKEYLVAIIAEEGILRAETLRFHDELRTPGDVDLSDPGKPDAAKRKKIEQAIRRLHADELDRDALADVQSRRLERIVQRKLDSGEGVVRAPESAEPSERESAEVIDLMTVLKRSLQEKSPGGSSGTGRKRPRAAARRDELEQQPKSKLYQRAQRLDIPGRSNMSKDELVEAIRNSE